MVQSTAMTILGHLLWKKLMLNAQMAYIQGQSYQETKHKTFCESHPSKYNLTVTIEQQILDTNAEKQLSYTATDV